jgi:sensor histidine kinase regulating citrate/malate metabolism
MFQRSFSTKGSDRGLGTYSMKLLGERYLHGEVEFTTSQEEGTTFRLILPLELHADKIAA